MKRRIFGLENEYGLTCMLNGQHRLSPDNIARYLFEGVIPGARNANVFLENGARLYLDTGFHPEYATPECDDVAAPGGPTSRFRICQWRARTESASGTIPGSKGPKTGGEGAKERRCLGV